MARRSRSQRARAALQKPPDATRNPPASISTNGARRRVSKAGAGSSAIVSTTLEGAAGEVVAARSGRATVVAALVAGLVALAVYLATLAPSLPPGDSGDLITAAVTVGVAHPPGYPLFAIVGHLFSLLPLGSPAYRLNLMSAVLDAAAVGVVAALIHRLVTGTGVRGDAFGRFRPWVACIPAIVGALFLAFAAEFWSYSLVAEVFAMNNLFAAVLLLLAFTWFQDPSRRWPLWAFLLTSGLAFCNQQTIVLLAPGLATFLVAGIVKRRKESPAWLRDTSRDLAIGAGFLLIGLLPYAYLPIAAAGNPPALWGDPSSLERFIAVVTRSDYGSFSLLGGGRHGTIGENLGALVANIAGSFGPSGGVLALLGLLWLARHRPAPALALLLAFLFSGPLFLAYANPPLGGLLTGVFARFYILPSIPLAVVVGSGAWQALVLVARVLGAAPQPATARLRLAGAFVLAVILASLVAIPAAARRSDVDQSSNRMTINFVRDLLTPLDRNAVLLTEGDTSVLGTWYAQSAEGYRDDVVVIAVPLLRFQWYIDQFRRQHPDVSIPFDAKDMLGKPITDRVVAANVARRSVYYVGVIDEAFPTGFGELRTGFARKFVPKAEGSDPFAYVRTHLPELSSYSFPTRSYPPTSWENWESGYYAGAAFDLANAYETVDVKAAESWYREAILLGPGISGSYKNLAILLSANGGHPSEIADLLERYLMLAPNDPEAATIKANIAQLRAEGR